MYRPSTRERGNTWSRIADSLNSIDNPEFYVNQRAVRERFNLILTRYKTKEQTPTEELLEEFDKKNKRLRLNSKPKP